MTAQCKTISFLLVVFMAAAPADPAPLRPVKETGRRILSLRRQSEHAFASTADGLYRASLDKKQWQHLTGKTVPEPGGLFVPGRPEEKTLYYFVTQEARRKATDFLDKIDDPRRPGLYRSTDLGDTWQLLNNTHHFCQVVHLPGGRGFALALVQKNQGQRQIVLLSENGGRDWKDISNGVTAGRPLLFIIRDPDHSQLICLFSAQTRRSGGEILQAADDQFRWKSVHRSLRSPHDWPPDEKKTEEEFFYHWYYVGYSLRWPAGSVERLPDEYPGTFGKESIGFSTSAMIHARLDNYFTLPFPAEKGISGFDILAEKAVYEFGPKQPLLVSVALIRYKDGEPPSLNPQLVDAKDARFFWSLKVSGPDAQKIDLWPKDRENPFDDREKGQRLADLLKKHDAWQFLLTSEKPARRAIDLRDLGMPDKPGTYRVQLRYTCSWTDDRSIRRTLYPPVTGQVFRVTIRAGN